MNTPPHIPSPSIVPDIEDVFHLRVWARAYLYAVGELDLHEAVDVLADDAITTGLVDQVGEDAVQAIVADAFKRVRP
jgi:hypothetical protein